MAELRGRREYLAWAAGFFDGEGTTCSIETGRKNRYLRMTVANTNLDLLRQFQCAVSAGWIQGPTLKPGRKPIYVWACTARRAYYVLCMLWTFLGKEKRRQAMAALARAGMLPGQKEAAA